MDSAGKNVQNSKVPPPLPMDLAESIKGMYRLLDLISESGSNGCGNDLLRCLLVPGLNFCFSS